MATKRHRERAEQREDIEPSGPVVKRTTTTVIEEFANPDLDGLDDPEDEPEPARERDRRR